MLLATLIATDIDLDYLNANQPFLEVVEILGSILHALQPDASLNHTDIL